ncbi:hypothetical protein [Microbulbifer yueqingensis]|uniref:Uncharacterized protein n=1 Tax=Microbulbifer yueqingensis TaxID=658219 RepID=A0A1G9EKD6_9GAMM|nr:hypothetical protein [Microbulbifer yueqingensis]SDK76485.1 hypothetical protein SAMN05216212_3165 [Microbulbifer yueqingensis]
MSIVNTVREFLVATFWPWFKEYAWPIIKQHLIEIISSLVKIISEKIQGKMAEKASSQVNDFEVQAAKAEQSAMDSLDPNEIKKLKREAQIWREVAERLKKDNAALVKDLAEIAEKSKIDTINSLKNTELDIATEGENAIFTIGGTARSLPLVEGK